MKLLVRNLNRSTKEDELLAIFEGFGEVVSCTLVMDQVTGGSKGFGFVEMTKEDDAKAAIKKLHNELLDGNKIRVKKAEDKQNEDASSENKVSKKGLVFKASQ